MWLAHFYVQMHSPSPHSTSVVLSCFLVPPPGSFPHFLSNLLPLAPATFFLLTLHRNTSHHTSNYKVNFTFYFSFFLPPPLLPQKLVYCNVQPQYEPLHMVSVPIPRFLKHSTFHKATSKLLSAIINHCSSCLLCYFPHLLPWHL